MKTTLILTGIETTREEIRKQCVAFKKRIDACLRTTSLEFVSPEALLNESYALVFVGSGGSAQDFKRIFQQRKGPFLLLAMPDNNSLAASMEMLSFVNDHGERGEIIYGTPEEIAKRLEVLDSIFRLKAKMKHMRFGVLGTPNMLINSESDMVVLKASTGIETTVLPMDAVMEEIDKQVYEPTPDTERLMACGYDKTELKKALDLYGGIRRLVDANKFDGIALRCFDLLAPYRISGCLALSLLNAQGVYAACEGDTRSLLSMMILGKLSGKPVFMANPSRIDTHKGTMVFAHCTLPLNMVSHWSLTTHFESGFGVAVRGEFEPGSFTLFKCRENMRQYFVQHAKFLSNPDDCHLCRSQIELKVDDYTTYLEHPLSNHQVMCEGDYVSLVQEFFKWE